MLALFVTGHASDMDHLRAALAESRTEDARLIVHSLKGVAATLGAMELRDLAVAVERELMEAGLATALGTLAALECAHAGLLANLKHAGFGTGDA